MGVARRVEGVLVHEDERERALDPRQHLQGGSHEGRGLGLGRLAPAGVLPARRLLGRRLLARGFPSPIRGRGRGVPVRLGHSGGDGGSRDEGGGSRNSLGHTQQCRHEGGVGRRPAFEVLAFLGDGSGQLAQLQGVRKVAVVGEGERSGGGGPEGRLGVTPHVRAGRRVADVPEGDVPAQSLQGLLGKNVRDQALILVHEDLLAVGGRDAGALLAAMLEGVEGEVGETRNVLARGPHSEDAAVIAGTIVSEELLIGQCHVWLRDGKHDSTLSHFSSLSGTCPRCATHTRSLRGDPSVNCACFPPGHPVTRWPRCHNGVQQP